MYIFTVFMSALHSRCERYIFALWLLYFSIFFSSSNLSFHTWYGLSANLGCRSEMCCTRLTENTDLK